jgi:KipI family sensor histidine kinase inhibitor
MYNKARFLTVGDRGISVEFGDDLNEETNRLVHKMKFTMEKEVVDGVVETIPTIRSLYVYYDPRMISYDRLLGELKTLAKKMTEISLPKSRLFEIPVLYGGKHGPDFNTVTKLVDLTPDELIQIHSGKEFFILQTGFIGGSAHFMIPPPLDSLPRKKTPNLGVPAGAVLIAGGMGSVFKPLEGPTGWYWIGMSPLRQWFPDKEPPLLINPGDKIVYKPVTEKEFMEIKIQVDEDRYDPEMMVPDK